MLSYIYFKNMKFLSRLPVLVGFLVFFCCPYVVHAKEIYTTDKLITVDTSKQMLYAWEGGRVVYQTVVSTGLWQTPTVLGSYSIYLKYPSQEMIGYSIVNG